MLPLSAFGTPPWRALISHSSRRTDGGDSRLADGGPAYGPSRAGGRCSRRLHGGPRGRYRRGCGVSTGAKPGSGCARSDTPVIQPITTRFGSPRIATMTSQPRPQAPSHASKRAMAGWKSSPCRRANAPKTASMFGATVYSGDSGAAGAGPASTAGGTPGAPAAAGGPLADARRPAGTAGGGMAVAGVAREPAVLAIEPPPC